MFIMTEVFNEQKKGLSIASLVLGIIGLCTSCTFVGIICGALAIIFGGFALHKKEGIRGLSIAGLILGIVSLGLTLILLLIVGVSFASLAALVGMH